MTIKLGILKGFKDFDAFTESTKLYAEGCEEIGVEYEIIDFTSPDWIELVNKSDCDGFLVRPPCNIQERKSVFDERLYFLNKVLKKPIFPSFDELFIYENKRNMATWLEIFGVPHAKTKIFVLKEDALNYINNSEYPLVFKTNIGAASSGVTMVKSKKQAKKIINNVFGIKPSLALGNFYFLKKFGLKILPNIGEAQKHYLIVQEFRKIKWEWRIIKVGNSYFGRKKCLKGLFASGTGLIEFEEPPKELLYMAKDICEKGNFNSMSIDIFETEEGEFLVNELQSLWGYKLEDETKALSAMWINGVPGRFVFENNDFVFQEGTYGKDGCYSLRVKTFVEQLETAQKN